MQCYDKKKRGLAAAMLEGRSFKGTSLSLQKKKKERKLGYTTYETRHKQ